MVKRSVRVYIEGGARGSTADSDFRRGWKKFLDELHILARKHGYQALEVVRGKGRNDTYRRFKTRERIYHNDLCVLLVDSETAVPKSTSVWDVVANRDGDGWHRPSWATERHLFLMVHLVETWLLTDQEALQKFFGQGFDIKKLPASDLEDRPKADINDALRAATLKTKKGPYHHGQAHEIIGFVRPDKVRSLSHGQRLFKELGELITSTSISK